MWETIEEHARPELKDPVLLVSLSTSIQQYKALYSQGRELGKFMLKNMEFEKFATLYSSSMPPLVMISDDGIIRLSSTSFYRFRGDRDLVLLAGDASPVEHQYEYCESVLGYAEKLGIHEVVSVGTRWTEEAGSPVASPTVKGFATDKKGVEELEKLGVEIIREEPAPFFASLVVALAPDHGMRGFKLSVDHGEPTPHPRSIMQVLAVLQKMLGFKVETSHLDEVATKIAADLEGGNGGDSPPRRPGIYG
jgi:proteasome assembly chaperone (PAC2) family protein